MTHRRRPAPRLFTWSNGLRVLGAGGFVFLLASDGPERTTYMLACLALATFGLPSAIKLDLRRDKEKDPPA